MSLFHLKPLRQQTDEQLMTRAAAGSDAAFEELYRRYARRLKGFFFMPWQAVLPVEKCMKRHNEYFKEAENQCQTGIVTYGSITNSEVLRHNLEMNSIPEEVKQMDYTNYTEFLEKRRMLMAEKIRRYYYGL